MTPEQIAALCAVLGLLGAILWRVWSAATVLAEVRAELRHHREVQDRHETEIRSLREEQNEIGREVARLQGIEQAA